MLGWNSWPPRTAGNPANSALATLWRPRCDEMKEGTPWTSLHGSRGFSPVPLRSQWLVEEASLARPKSAKLLGGKHRRTRLTMRIGELRSTTAASRRNHLRQVRPAHRQALGHIDRAPFHAAAFALCRKEESHGALSLSQKGPGAPPPELKTISLDPSGVHQRCNAGLHRGRGHIWKRGK